MNFKMLGELEKVENSLEYYKQKIIQVTRRNQVCFSSSNLSTDTTHCQGLDVE